MRFRDKNGPTLYPILKTAGFAGFFRRRAQRTLYPPAISSSTTGAPTNPVAPVTKTRLVVPPLFIIICPLLIVHV